MIGETYEDYYDCHRQAFEAAAVHYTNSSSHVLIYKDTVGLYYHTDLLDRNSQPSTDDTFVEGIDSFYPYENIDQDEDELSWEDAIDFCYSRE